MDEKDLKAYEEELTSYCEEQSEKRIKIIEDEIAERKDLMRELTDFTIECYEKEVEYAKEAIKDIVEDALEEIMDEVGDAIEDIGEMSGKGNSDKTAASDEKKKKEENTKKTGKPIVSLAQVGQAALDISEQAINSALELDSAVEKFMDDTGSNTSLLEDYRDVMSDIYSNNYGESFEDIGETMGTVASNMHNLAGDALQNATEGAYALRDAFGIDIADSTRVAGLLMTECGIKSGQAMDYLAANAEKLGDSWGDIGIETIKALGDVKGSMAEVNGAMDKLQEKEYGDLTSLFEHLNRCVETLLIPLGDALIPILEMLITTILPIIQQLLPQIIDPIAELIEFVLPPLLELLSSALTILLPILDAVIGLVQPVVNLIKQALNPLIQVIQTVIGVAIEPLMAIMNALAFLFKEVTDGIFQNVSDSIASVISIFTNFIDFFKNFFSGQIDAAIGNLGGMILGFVGGFYNLLKTPANVIVDAINAVIGGLNKIKVPDWIPGIGGKELNIPLIPRFKSGLDYVPSDFFPAFLDEGEMVLTRSEANWVRSMGGLGGLEYRLSGGQFNQDQKVVLGKGCIVVQTMLDGRTLAQTSAPYLNEELGNIAELRNRGV